MLCVPARSVFGCAMSDSPDLDAIRARAETPMKVVERLERDVRDWRNCQLTSDEFSVRLSHAARDFGVAYDRECGDD